MGMLAEGKIFKECPGDLPGDLLLTWDELLSHSPNLKNLILLFLKRDAPELRLT